MRAFLATVCLAALLVSVGGCRFLSSDDEQEPFYFDVTLEDVEWSGSGSAAVDGGVVVIRGEYLSADSATRYVEITVPDFNGEQTYTLSRAAGIYGLIGDDESVQYGYSSGHPEDGVRIDDYDAEEGVLLGAFFFYGTAFQNFDDIEAFHAFRIAGEFRTRVGQEAAL